MVQRCFHYGSSWFPFMAAKGSLPARGRVSTARLARSLSHWCAFRAICGCELRPQFHIGHIRGASDIPAVCRLQHSQPENACYSVVFGNESGRVGPSGPEWARVGPSGAERKHEQSRASCLTVFLTMAATLRIQATS